MATTESANKTAFHDCFSAELLQRISSAKQPSHRKSGRSRKKLSSDSTTTDAADLADTIEYLSSEIFDSLPQGLQSLSYTTLQSKPDLESYLSQDSLATLLHSLPPSVPDYISTYSILPPSTSLDPLLSATLTAYFAAVASPPPTWALTKKDASACEICARDWIPLTYHHLIPKGVHEKVRKKGWHQEWELGRVAWLCRACHSFVHGLAGNEELARKWYSVELLMEREDVRRWAGWVGGVRWKAR